MVRLKKPWYVTPDGLKRRNIDAAILKERLPGVPISDVRSGRLIANGVATVVLSEHTRWSGNIQIIFPKTYPQRPPIGFILADCFQPRDAKRHFMADGSCCLYLPNVDDHWSGADPLALTSWLDQFMLFIGRQMLFDVLGRWVGPEWPHGYAAYALHIEERLGKDLVEAFHAYRKKPKAGASRYCPCGAERKFAECHEPAFRKLLTELSGQSERDILSGSNAKRSSSDES